MSKAAVADSTLPPEEVIDLKDPVVAAILGWFIPGLGHLYQGRRGKGLLFMITILSIFIFGLVISNGRAVYASWLDYDKRLPYLCQACVGLPALPALVQTYLVRNGREPLFGGVMAPPADKAQLDDLWKSLSRRMELGTVYTMIAGLLNVLAIYDAFAGPVRIEPPDSNHGKDDKPEDESGG